MKLAIRITRGIDGSYRAFCPALPGCVVWGTSLKEAKEKIDSAVSGYVASLDSTLPRELARLASLP